MRHGRKFMNAYLYETLDFAKQSAMDLVSGRSADQLLSDALQKPTRGGSVYTFGKVDFQVGSSMADAFLHSGAHDNAVSLHHFSSGTIFRMPTCSASRDAWSFRSRRPSFRSARANTTQWPSTDWVSASRGALARAGDWEQAPSLSEYSLVLDTAMVA